MDENLRSLIMKINTFKYRIHAITIGGLTSYKKNVISNLVRTTRFRNAIDRYTQTQKIGKTNNLKVPGSKETQELTLGSMWLHMPKGDTR